MTGKEYIEYRINTGDRFLVNLHKDSRELLAIILEQYAALRQPLVISSVCTCTKFRETPMINGNHICSICNKPIVQTDL